MRLEKVNLPVGLEIVAHKLMTISAFRTRRTVRRLRILIAKFVSLVAVILQCGLCITKKESGDFFFIVEPLLFIGWLCYTFRYVCDMF